MENMKILLFEEVPIRLQVRDGNPRLKPIATVMGPDDKVLQEIQLDHVTNGLYKPAKPYLMPDLDFIVVQYDTLDDFYELAVEMFHVESPPAPPLKFIIGIITSVERRGGMAVGSVVSKRRRVENEDQNHE